MFTLIGKEAVICDKKADAAEVDAFSDYITMLCDFYTQENPDSPVAFTHDIRKDFETIKTEADSEEETLDDLLAELDGLIGLYSVKKDVHSLLHLQHIQMERKKRGLPRIPMSNHLVFTGNPGTGKTTVAGYPKLMETFISSNPGLRSRFSKKIFFPDYNPDELLEILQHMVKKQSFTISEEALDCAYDLLEKKYNSRGKDFANAREVRNLFEAAVVSQADRLYGKENLTDEDLCRLEADDFRFNGLVIE